MCLVRGERSEVLGCFGEVLVEDVAAAGRRTRGGREPADAASAAATAAPRAAGGIFLEGQCRAVPKDTEVREVPEPWGRVRS